MDVSTLSSMPLYLPNQVSGSKDGNSTGTQQDGLSFSQIINQKIDEANSSQKDADQLTESYLTGGPVDVQQMLIAMEKADLALRETVEIRNKVVDAYKQIEGMQI